MEQRRLGRSDLSLSVIGLGTWAIGGDWLYGWGTQSDSDSRAAIDEALASGINWIDTAPAYGLGAAEELLGRALEGRRDQVIIATKCGLIDDGKRGVFSRLTRKSVLEEAEASLRRLRTDRIDLYQIHWPNPAPDIEEAFSAIEELRNQGKVRWAGVSNFDAVQMERVAPFGELVSLQPPYSMVVRDIEKEIVPWCLKHQVGIVAYSPLQSGLLTDKASRAWFNSLPKEDWRRGERKLFREPELTKTLELVDTLKAAARGFDMTMAQLAVSWVLAQPGITSAIVGARKAGQIGEFARAGSRRLSDAELETVKEIIGPVPWSNRGTE